MPHFLPTKNRRAALLAAALLAALGSTGTAHSAPYKVSGVVLDGLANPRSIAVGPDGALWVVEAGSGGTGPSIVNDGGETVLFGNTGQVTRVLGGTAAVVASDLPSLAQEGGFAATGANDLAFAPDGTPYVLFGFGADPSLRSVFSGESQGNLFGQLVALEGGGLTAKVDLAAFELTNPDGGGVNSNPYGIAAQGDGFVVTDAGGNTILDVASDGSVSVRAVLPSSANPLPFGPPAYESVPTGIAAGPSGSVIVGELTGFPFPPGEANIYAAAADGSLSVVVSGLTNIIDLALGEDGTIFALELDSDSLIGPEAVGSLYAIDDLGVKTLILSGLVNPTSVAVTADGRILIAENGLSPADGRILELSSVPVPAALPLMAAGLASVMALGRRRRR
ncbi:ScyD/ScyE family protein [Parvularcula maris]|uniref:ScyD/ScyE family protein n=1 Tax=Parvularcula maris TaxID=2965077 RepID=A0A9X2LAQ8_9PROT|nr:ScyD/ScyE family protein [Parvularcula maris]MCQ8186073.1 ScyD/ScyE family protein [Parvularcula maris]